MYDYYLNGKDNFPADREAAELALSVFPAGRALAWANRRFMVTAVEFLARKGIDQFIDVGTGIPTSPNVHEIARSIIPTATVAYVDNDPQVLVHDRALLAGSEGIAVVDGDARHAGAFADDDDLREVIDFTRPVGVLFVAVLHFVRDEEDPWESVSALRDLIAPGSYLVLSHGTSDGSDPTTVRAIQEAYQNAAAPAVFRAERDIARFFDGFRLVYPGITDVSDWHPTAQPQPTPGLRIIGGAGEKQS
jgi:S-adenosyl methyltransferase